jgi:AbrB family looped-hinge helix DNA binding protein
MHEVTVSTKFQVVIPKTIRKYLNIQPGQKMQVITYNDRVVFVPVRPIQEARGSLKGIHTDVPRDEEERV